MIMYDIQNKLKRIIYSIVTIFDHFHKYVKIFKI